MNKGLVWSCCALWLEKKMPLGCSLNYIKIKSLCLSYMSARRRLKTNGKFKAIKAIFLSWRHLSNRTDQTSFLSFIICVSLIYAKSKGAKGAEDVQCGTHMVIQQLSVVITTTEIRAQRWSSTEQFLFLDGGFWPFKTLQLLFFSFSTFILGAVKHNSASHTLMEKDALKHCFLLILVRYANFL